VTHGAWANYVLIQRHLAKPQQLQFRSRNLLHLCVEEPHGFTTFLGFQSGNVEQAVPVVAKVFKALKSVKARSPFVADVDESLRLTDGNLRNLRVGERFAKNEFEDSIFR
jgi:hypothetical protein